jgi:8-oxo-dGTP pyrophosphatase MutT (NUDIX family)
VFKGEVNMVVQTRMAAAVMLLRASLADPGIEVFMVRRSTRSAFLPDVYVFPGGTVNEDDRLAEQTPGVCEEVHRATNADPESRTVLGSGMRAAAIRELFEEANVLLALQDGQLLAINEHTLEHFAAYRQAFNERKGSLITLAHVEHLTLATAHLVYFAHWITPIGEPKRYDTHFFLAQAPAAQEAIYDRLETSDGVWIQPATALERSSAKSFPLAFPTIHQLRALSTFSTVQAALETAAIQYVKTYQPTRIEHKGHVSFVLNE